MLRVPSTPLYGHRTAGRADGSEVRLAGCWLGLERMDRREWLGRRDVCGTVWGMKCSVGRDSSQSGGLEASLILAIYRVALGAALYRVYS